MPGPIEQYMQEDHERLDRLRRAGAWWEFRGGLLRHIGLEEKILLPDARRRRDGEPLPEAPRLREDHGLLTTLLVPPPSPPIEDAIDGLLVPHNAIEEGPAGVYARCDALAGVEAEAIAARLRTAPATPQRPHQDGPRVRAQVERALQVLALRGR
ncbi:MAG TPA: hemerythrin domain-containing protein [Myxococcales bacterium]|nr:hemerythrin domain-containing protein [Myxococcales bacterium]